VRLLVDLSAAPHAQALQLLSLRPAPVQVRLGLGGASSCAGCFVRRALAPLAFGVCPPTCSVYPTDAELQPHIHTNAHRIAQSRVESSAWTCRAAGPCPFKRSDLAARPHALRRTTQLGALSAFHAADPGRRRSPDICIQVMCAWQGRFGGASYVQYALTQLLVTPPSLAGAFPQKPAWLPPPRLLPPVARGTEATPGGTLTPLSLTPLASAAAALAWPPADPAGLAEECAGGAGMCERRQKKKNPPPAK